MGLLGADNNNRVLVRCPITRFWSTRQLGPALVSRGPGGPRQTERNKDQASALQRPQAGMVHGFDELHISVRTGLAMPVHQTCLGDPGQRKIWKIWKTQNIREKSVKTVEEPDSRETSQSRRAKPKTVTCEVRCDAHLAWRKPRISTVLCTLWIIGTSRCTTSRTSTTRSRC